jgi:cobalamin synthase
MALRRELGAAVGCVTVLGPPSAASRADLAGGLAFHPAVGLALGAIAAGIATLVERAWPPAAGPAGVLVLALLEGGRGARGLAAATSLLRSGTAASRLARLRAVPGPSGALLAFAALAGRAAAAAVLPPPARATGLLLAPMLGAWGAVVQC